MFARWESIETILLSTSSPGATQRFIVKVLINTGDAKRITTDNCNWRIKKARKIQKVFESPYEEKTLPQSGFICFLDVRVNI